MALIFDGYIGSGVIPGFGGFNPRAIFWGNSGYTAIINGDGEYQELSVDTSNSIIDGWFSDSSNGILLTTEGEVFTSLDGGESWQQKTSIPDKASGYTYRATYILDANTAFVGGKSATTGNAIWKTSDGGNTWSIVQNANDVQPIESFSFISPSVGYAVDIARVYKTTDSGNTWSIIKSLAWGDEISMVNSNVGFIATEANGGSAYTTSNEWSTVTSINLGFDPQQGVYAINESIAMIVGNAGNFARTTNRTTWTGTTYGSDTLTCIHFNGDASYGYMAGGNSVFYSEDSGATWTQETQIPSGVSINSIFTF